MKIERFEDIISWQKARVLTREIYTIFRPCRDYSFKDHIQKTSISIMNNIAEGFERETDQEFKRFLYISKGSCGEIRSMLYTALDLGYINKDRFNQFYKLSSEISRLIAGLIKSLEEKLESRKIESRRSKVKS